MRGSDDTSPRILKGPEGSARILETLYEIVQRTGNTPTPSEAAGVVLDALVSRMETGKGVVGLLGDRGFSVLSVRGMKATEAVSRCAGQDTSGPFVLLKDRRAPFRSWQRIPGANPAREHIAFFGVPVPGARSRRAVVIVDRLLDAGAGPEEDLRLLAAAAAFLARHLPGNPEGASGVNGEEEVVPLGRVLQQEISAWIGPMEYSRRLRSDVLERLVGEVEKIAIAAALEKTGYVQTETARFLGINRNTLARKMQRHGLRGRGG